MTITSESSKSRHAKLAHLKQGSNESMAGSLLVAFHLSSMHWTTALFGADAHFQAHAHAAGSFPKPTQNPVAKKAEFTTSPEECHSKKPAAAWRWRISSVALFSASRSSFEEINLENFGMAKAVRGRE